MQGRLLPLSGCACPLPVSLPVSQVVTASRSQNPQLFAASCGGGGGNFGAGKGPRALLQAAGGVGAAAWRTKHALCVSLLHQLTSALKRWVHAGKVVAMCPQRWLCLPSFRRHRHALSSEAPSGAQDVHPGHRADR